jgi:hypothetical protein
LFILPSYRSRYTARLDAKWDLPILTCSFILTSAKPGSMMGEFSIFLHNRLPSVGKVCLALRDLVTTIQWPRPSLILESTNSIRTTYSVYTAQIPSDVVVRIYGRNSPRLVSFVDSFVCFQVSTCYPCPVCDHRVETLKRKL